MSFELLKDRGYFKDHGVDVMVYLIHTCGSDRIGFVIDRILWYI